MVSGMSDSEKLRVLFSEDSNFLTEFTISESLPKVDTTRIDGVAQGFLFYSFIAGLKWPRSGPGSKKKYRDFHLAQEILSIWRNSDEQLVRNER